jgi:hypothetical protein
MARTKPAAESGMKTESSSTLTSEVSGLTEEAQSEKRSVPDVRLQSVQFMFPTIILNLNSLAGISDAQANLQWFKHGVLVTSKDDRVQGINFIPMGAIKALKFIDAFPGELLLN